MYRFPRGKGYYIAGFPGGGGLLWVKNCSTTPAVIFFVPKYSLKWVIIQNRTPFIHNKKTGKLFVLILDISIKLYDSFDHVPTVMITPIKVKNNSLLLFLHHFSIIVHLIIIIDNVTLIFMQTPLVSQSVRHLRQVMQTVIYHAVQSKYVMLLNTPISGSMPIMEL